jgi:hypothetical protein
MAGEESIRSWRADINNFIEANLLTINIFNMKISEFPLPVPVSNNSFSVRSSSYSSNPEGSPTTNKVT